MKRGAHNCPSFLEFQQKTMTKNERKYIIDGVTKAIHELTDKELLSCAGLGGLSIPSQAEAEEIVKRGLITREKLEILNI